MKKKIIIILSVILIVFVVFWAIDMNRMKNNLPVIFSTWGYKYSLPLEEKVDLGKVIQITDRTITENMPCADALEKFYEDDNYEYYFNCIKSEHIIVEYENGYKEDIKSAFKYGTVTLGDLERFNIGYIVEAKDKDNVVTISHNSTENLPRLYQFIDNTKYDSENRKEDEIRVITYTIEGDPIIKDIKLVMNNEESYYEIITDTTQDKFGVPQVIAKKYDASLYTITVKNGGDYNETCLTELPQINRELEDISICTIIGTDVDGDGYDEFELEVIESNSGSSVIDDEKSGNQILENGEIFERKMPDELKISRVKSCNERFIYLLTQDKNNYIYDFENGTYKLVLKGDEIFHINILNVLEHKNVVYINAEYNNGKVTLMGIDYANATILTETECPSGAIDIIVSDDEQKIAYRKMDENGSAVTLYIADKDGKNEKVLLEGVSKGEAPETTGYIPREFISSNKLLYNCWGWEHTKGLRNYKF